MSARAWVGGALALAALHLAILAVPVVQSQPSDDAILLIPMLLADLEGKSFWEAVAYLFHPNQPLLPRGPWTLYVLASLRLFGGSTAALVGTGLALHLGCSVLVLTLARRLDLRPEAAWLAGLLHFTAYPGSHAYLWPVGVQHVLTILGVLGVLNLYLATERRLEAGRPAHALRWITTVVAVLASLNRSPSAIGPIAMLAHLLLAPGSAADRLRRLDRWRPAILLAAPYPLALLATGADGRPFAVPSLAVLFPDAGSGRAGAPLALAAGLAAVLGALLALRLALQRLARRGGAAWAWPRWARLACWVGLGLAASPWLLRTAVIAVGGVETFFAPLQAALTGINTARWHVHALPLGPLGVGLTVLLGAALLTRRPRHAGLLLLLPLLVGFGASIPAEPAQASRYWIYLTPALAILFAAALDELHGRWAPRILAPGPWRAALGLALIAVLVLSSAAAIRLEAWRHALADAFLVLDYVRVADLIRADLHRAGVPPDTPICVDGLAPPPYDAVWRETLGAPASLLRENAGTILAGTLGGPPARIRLDCTGLLPGGARVYAVTGTEVTRAGEDVDQFQRTHATARALAAAGDHDGILRLAGDPARSRPFIVRHLLGTLPDDDLEWLSNGGSLLAWIEGMAENFDRWFGRPEPKVQAIKSMAEAEIVAHVRFRALVAQARERSLPALAGARGPRFAFGGLGPEALAGILRSDPQLGADPGTRAMVESIEAGVPAPPAPRIRAAPRVLPSPAFFGFLARLLASDLGALAAAVRGTPHP